MELENSINTLIKGNFINQMPGLFIIVNQESRFLAANKIALDWVGFKSDDAMAGETYCNMPCKAAEQHDLFTQQDQITIKRNNPLRILGYYCYANDIWRVLFGEKYLLRDASDEIIGIALHFNDITNYNMIDLAKLLNITTSGYSVNIRKQQVNCLLEDNYPSITLTGRQSECMFFLLRGKTAKEIAKILNLSPKTVEEYIEEIKNRLNCFTKSELIEKAIAYGYMNIIPKSLLAMLK